MRRRKIQYLAVMTMSLALSGMIALEAKAEWQYGDDGRWWNTNISDLGYSVGWELVDGVWYHFDEGGWMQSGWINDAGVWYYCDGSGAMLSNQWIGNYYLTANGAMAANTWVGNYYVGADGAWVEDLQQVSSGWRQDGGLWWYQDENGGYPANEWKQIDGKWYYFYENGYMASSCWIGDYYVGADGAMYTNRWTPDGYYVGADGSWVRDWEQTTFPGWKQDAVGWWYQEADGSYPSNCWKEIGGKQYYFNANGYLVTNSWIEGYYVGESGERYIDRWTPDGYFVDKNGRVIEANRRMRADGLDVEGLGIGGYDYIGGRSESGGIVEYTTRKSYYANPDKVSYYLDGNGNLNVAAYDSTTDLGGYIGNKRLSVTTYNSQMQCINKRSVALPYELWGGMLVGSDGYFYVANGQYNTNDDRTGTVMKVLRYDSQWQLTGTVDIHSDYDGFGIREPFHAGNCKMALKDGVLVIHTSRLMYPYIDGLSHQSNITFAVDVNKMKLMESFYGPYASHSFNQYVKNDGDNLIYIDHGDAYPRELSLTSYENFSKGEGADTKSLTLFPLLGESGANFTGLTVSGFETGRNHNLVVGTAQPHTFSVAGTSGFESGWNNNAYIILVNKACDSSSIKWLTNNSPSDTSVEVGEPRIVKLSDDRFVVLYSVEENEQDTLYYKLLDSNGTVLTEKQYNGIYFPASSDPIVVNNEILWVAPDKGVHNSKTNYFYTIPLL